MNIFDEKLWSEKVQQENWYKDVPELLAVLSKLRDTDKPMYEEEKERVYDFFEEGLRKELIFLAKSGKDWDEEREPIDTAIIHHTSIDPGLTKERLSAIELFRLYAPYYASPYGKTDGDIAGKPIWSNHLRNGKQVFYPYHFIIRKNGKIDALLEDAEIGWHAGKWEINKRSIGIALDNDYKEGTPSDVELKAIAGIIKKYQIKTENVLGHCEVNPKTVCPSKIFLGTNGWKEKLLEFI